MERERKEHDARNELHLLAMHSNGAAFFPASTARAALQRFRARGGRMVGMEWSLWRRRVSWGAFYRWGG
jgi:hypothetical protein